VGERVIIPKLREVLTIVNRRVYKCHRIGIGLEEVPIDSLSPSGGSKDVWFSVLDDESDEGQRSKAFFSIEVSGVEWEEGDGIDIRADPRFPRMDGTFFFCVFSWWSWNKAW
jgi:hypothetical protein